MLCTHVNCKNKTSYKIALTTGFEIRLVKGYCRQAVLASIDSWGLCCVVIADQSVQDVSINANIEMILFFYPISIRVFT